MASYGQNFNPFVHVSRECEHSLSGTQTMEESETTVLVIRPI